MKWFFACVLAAVLIVPLWYLYTNQRQQEVQPPLAHEQLPHPGSGQRLVLIDELAELPPRRDPAQAQALSEQANWPLPQVHMRLFPSLQNQANSRMERATKQACLRVTPRLRVGHHALGIRLGKHRISRQLSTHQSQPWRNPSAQMFARRPHYIHC